MARSERGTDTVAQLAPAATAVVSAVVVLGPALGRGVVLSYDLVWSPDRRLTPFATGVGTPVPRAVPSDTVVWLLGWLVTPALAEKVTLLAVLVLASLGVVALLRQVRPDVGPLAASTAALAAIWNPFVSERLVVGQWTVLLGYAVVPWALRAAVRVVSAPGGRWALVLPLALAGLGGVNTVLIVAAGEAAVLIAGLHRDVRRVGADLVLAGISTAGVSAVWALPSLAAAAPVDRAGVGAFAPTPDTPLGVWGSVISGGGFWNSASHPEPRSMMLIALLAAVLSISAFTCFAVDVRRSRQWLLLVPVLVGLLVVILSALPASRSVWTWLVTEVPGGGALRDSQKFLAVWVMAVSVGIGGGVDRLRQISGPATGMAGVGVATVVGVVLLLSPQLAWGVGGQLDAEPVPPGYRAAASRLSSLPQGEVGLLPWSQYRRYDWNGDRVSLTLAPRIIDQRVLFNDSLPLRSGEVRGENARAAAVSDEIAQGMSPESVLSGVGVRYIAAELGSGLKVDQDSLRRAGHVVVDDSHLLVVELPGPSGAGVDASEATGWGALGWLLTTLTVGVIVAGAALSSVRRKLPVGLLRSRP